MWPSPLGSIRSPLTLFPSLNTYSPSCTKGAWETVCNGKESVPHLCIQDWLCGDAHAHALLTPIWSSCHAPFMHFMYLSTSPYAFATFTVGFHAKLLHCTSALSISSGINSYCINPSVTCAYNWSTAVHCITLGHHHPCRTISLWLYVYIHIICMADMRWV